MANFVLLFHGGSMPETPEEGQKIMAAWTDWFAALGPALIDGGNPASNTKTLGADGSVTDDPNGQSGYSIISADSLDAAVELARGCPVRAGGAAISVVETFPVM
ncbi:MAG: YciI family protein [Candidatus Limnocylindrales bacterium]